MPPIGGDPVLDLDVDAHHDRCHLCAASYVWPGKSRVQRYHGDDFPFAATTSSTTTAPTPRTPRSVPGSSGRVRVEDGAADPLWESRGSTR